MPVTGRRQLGQVSAVKTRPGTDVHIGLRVELVPRRDPDAHRARRLACVRVEPHERRHVEMVRPAQQRPGTGPQAGELRCEFFQRFGRAAEPAGEFSQFTAQHAELMGPAPGRVIGQGVRELHAACRPEAERLKLGVDPGARRRVGPAVELERVEDAVAAGDDELEPRHADSDPNPAGFGRQHAGDQRRVRRVPGEGEVAVVGDCAQVGTRSLGRPLRRVMCEIAGLDERRRRHSTHFRPVESHGISSGLRRSSADNLTRLRGAGVLSPWEGSKRGKPCRSARSSRSKATRSSP